MRATCAAALFLSVAALAAGQDAKPEKLANHKPAVGDKTKVSTKDLTDLAIEVAVGDGKQTIPVKSTTLTEYTEEVLAVADGKKTKVTRAYTKARTEGDKAATRPYEGKTVTIAKSGDKFEFTVGDKPVDGADAEALDKEFNDPDKGNPDDLLPAKPVAVGDEWAMAKEAVAKFNSAKSPVTIDPAKSKVTGKLTKSYAKGANRYGVVKTTGTLVATELRLGANAVALGDGSTIAIDMGTDAALDGKSPAGKQTGTITFKLAGDLPGGAGSVTMTGTTTAEKTVELR